MAAIHAASSTYLAHSAPGGKPKLVGVGEGVAEMSRDCSGIGDWGVAARSEGGAGGCMAGGVEDALRTMEVPLRATQEVSITRTPMLWGGNTETLPYHLGSNVQSIKTNIYSAGGKGQPSRIIKRLPVWHLGCTYHPERESLDYLYQETQTVSIWPALNLTEMSSSQREIAHFKIPLNGTHNFPSESPGKWESGHALSLQ